MSAEPMQPWGRNGEAGGYGDGTVSELEYTMVFKALKEGATKLEVSDYTSYLYSDETLNLTTGDSTVTVEAGDGTSSESSAGTTAVATGTGSVEIDGVTYTIYNDFFRRACSGRMQQNYDGV